MPSPLRVVTLPRRQSPPTPHVPPAAPVQYLLSIRSISPRSLPRLALLQSIFFREKKKSPRSFFVLHEMRRVHAFLTDQLRPLPRVLVVVMCVLAVVDAMGTNELGFVRTGFDSLPIPIPNSAELPHTRDANTYARRERKSGPLILGPAGVHRAASAAAVPAGGVDCRAVLQLRRVCSAGLRELRALL